MRRLFHLPLSPSCRKVRLALAEKRLTFELQAEPVWEQRPEYLALNPAGTVPTLVEADGFVVPDSAVIGEYLDETYPEIRLLGLDPAERVEARRLVVWFDGKFAREVTDNLAGVKNLEFRERVEAPLHELGAFGLAFGIAGQPREHRDQTLAVLNG